MLGRRHILTMKWRTAIMSAIILALFTFGPRLREDNSGQETAGRVGRSLLQEQDDGNTVSDNVRSSEDKCSDKGPQCTEEDPAIFKRKLKAWYRCVSHPEDKTWPSSSRPCPAESASAQRECNVEGYDNGTWGLTVSSNECRTLTYSCTGHYQGSSQEVTFTLQDS